MTKTSKYFRVATEGMTIDDRNIDRQTIEQLAETFNPETYGARVWLEHRRGLLPDGPFKAYGDVLALKTEPVETERGTRLGLFAQIAPTSDLININKAQQKLYASIEIDPDFADTGKPYLVGLGVTDTPASLSLDVLKFSSHLKTSPGNLFTAGTEINLEFEDDAPSGASKVAEIVKNMLLPFAAKNNQANHNFSAITQAIETLTQHVVQSDGHYNNVQKRIAEAETTLDALQEDLRAFKQRMDTEEAPAPQRPPATGSDGYLQTDY